MVSLKFPARSVQCNTYYRNNCVFNLRLDSFGFTFVLKSDNMWKNKFIDGQIIHTKCERIHSIRWGCTVSIRIYVYVYNISALISEEFSSMDLFSPEMVLRMHIGMHSVEPTHSCLIESKQNLNIFNRGTIFFHESRMRMNLRK